ncbi:MAG: hypothetical protein EU532_03190 [Promethearchaeota archaeon]|nr:MAG: hypothetical protein EU532_03190 [Candidatus Lokiarchaeota archaeon]
MRYVFKILIMGDPDSTVEYVTRAFLDSGEFKETYNEWYKEVNALENVCDLEVDVITDLISADFDEIIPIVDGIIFLLNPLEKEKLEAFELYYSIIRSVNRAKERDIPSLIIYYDSSGILPISVNELLENVWVNYPELEAFVNLPPNMFHQALECLCLAMISGDTPLNIENAWMRFPIFIHLANIYFEQENYFYAAQVMKKAALISEIYNSDEFYIHCEQTAYLFSKRNLYLEASKILENIDKRKFKEFRNLYHNAMILEGNKSFNKKEYEKAAIQYENAGQWASFELDNQDLVQESFTLAITSWISACKCENAFKVLERLPHIQVVPILEEILNKIINAAHYLISIGNLESAKDQLYYSIQMYQREGLFNNLKILTQEQIEVLIKLLKRRIKEKDIYLAKEAYDEIENLWESYKLKKINLDKELEELIKLFIYEYNFGMATTLINKLDTFNTKQKLTDLIVKTEEKKKASRDKEIQDNIQKGVNILKEFIIFEMNVIADLNSQVIEKSNNFIQKMEYLNAAKIIKNQSVFLNSIGKEEIANQILTKSLDILIDSMHFDTFFKNFSYLSEDLQEEYLLRIFPKFIEKLKQLKETENFEKNEKIFETSNRIYRNLMLYERSRTISREFIRLIKKEALRVVNIEENESGINKSTSLIKKANIIFSSYLDKEKDRISFNKIYKKIAEVYISSEEFPSAQTFIDKIEKPEYKSELHNKLEKLEAYKSKLESKLAEETVKAEILKEKLSIIRKKAQDAMHDRKNELKQRNGLKRAYFVDALNLLKKEEYKNAIESYNESIIRLERIKKFNLAGVSLAAACLLYLKDNKITEMAAFFEKIKKELSKSGKLFTETFPVTLIEYIIDLEKLQEEEKLIEALSFMENLPLFDEEIKVLYEILGRELVEEEIPEFEIGIGEIAKIRSEINKLAKKIVIEKQEFTKRKMMRRDYWNKAIEELSSNKLPEASSFYFDSYHKLIDKKFYPHAAVGLILGSMVLIKTKDFFNAKTIYENKLNEYPIIKSDLKALPEIGFMDYVFLAYENNIQELIELTVDILSNQLMLFEPEINFLKSLAGQEIIETGEKEALTRKDRVDLSTLLVELGQDIGTLQQKMGDVRSENEDILKKRKAMKRRYYDEILKLLKNEDFTEASNKYLQLADTFIKRKDLQSGALLILLYGLALLKAKEGLAKIDIKINSYLESLGLNKALIQETYYVSLLLLIITILVENLDDYKSKYQPFLKILPLFEEEKPLTEII